MPIYFTEEFESLDNENYLMQELKRKQDEQYVTPIIHLAVYCVLLSLIGFIIFFVIL